MCPIVSVHMNWIQTIGDFDRVQKVVRSGFFKVKLESAFSIGSQGLTVHWTAGERKSERRPSQMPQCLWLLPIGHDSCRIGHEDLKSASVSL